ncbi:MAG: DUF4215 domain-containing protein [Deltaproteobacteria bacterium]|nr:DUF4215 domain-containing protein [Deltaproteobacteria bacterium]
MWLSSNADGQTVITNTTIANNYGYAIYISANTTKALILNSTIIKNSGGIYNDDGGALVAKDTILAHNTMINCLGSLMLEGSNVIGDEGSCAVSGSGSSSFQELNSLVLAYVDSIEPGKSYFPLADKSIAINNASSGGPIYDQLGNLRDSKHDIGAIEATTTCGDGALYTSLGEECDDGSENSDTGECTTLCKNAKCGDSMVQASVETCDDGNATDGDGCNSACVSEKCGDTIVQTALGEACDDANDSNADACLSTCAAASCGDGFVQAGVEACDDGNKVDGDGCSSACAVEVAADEQKDQDKDQDKDKVDQVVGSAVVEEETGGGDGGDVNVSDGSNGGGEDVKVSDGNAEPAKAGSSGGCSLIR